MNSVNVTLEQDAFRDDVYEFGLDFINFFY